MVTSLTINCKAFGVCYGRKGLEGTAVSNDVTVSHARLFTLSPTALHTRTIFIKDF